MKVLCTTAIVCSIVLLIASIEFLGSPNVGTPVDERLAANLCGGCPKYLVNTKCSNLTNNGQCPGAENKGAGDAEDDDKNGANTMLRYGPADTPWTCGGTYFLGDIYCYQMHNHEASLPVNCN